jgi:hypothetical protein
MAILALPLLASGVGTTTAADNEPPARERAGFSFGAALDLRYDDNILQLSDEDIARLEEGQPSSRFRITSPDDWVSVLKLDGRVSHEVFSRRDTRVHLGVDVYRYATNDIKNWSEYRLDVAQELTASRRHLLLFRAGLDYVADFYLRELTDDDASFQAQTRIRNSARYDETAFFAQLDQEVVSSRLNLSLLWELGDRDYVADFDERDGDRTTFKLGCRVRPFGPSRAVLTVGWEQGRYDAAGDLARTPIPDDDISFEFAGPTFALTVPRGTLQRGRFEADYELERRDYVTTNVFDLSHFGRHDRRLEYGIRLVQRLRPGLDLALNWRRLGNDARFPTGLEPQDDVTDFVENRIDFGIRGRFGSGSPHSSTSKVNAPSNGDTP